MTAGPTLTDLGQLAHADGGWGYTPGALPQVEPTCLALLALAAEPHADSTALQRGLHCLEQWQQVDGAFRIRDGREEAVWPTALALFVLSHFDRAPAARSRASRWLLHVRGQGLDDPETFREDFDIDPDLVGWPWTEGTFSWTEPTAWACIALKRAGHGQHPRVREGLKLLLDRAFDQGGVNSGNRIVFGRRTEPVPTMSALMLLAFIGEEDHPRLRATREYLLGVAKASEDIEHLCWTRLALGPWSHEPNVAAAIPDIEQRIIAVHQARGDQPYFKASLPREALTHLALAGARNPFLATTTLTATPDDQSLHRARQPLTFRLASALRGLGIRAVGQLRGVPAQTQVHIASAPDYSANLPAILAEQYRFFRDTVSLAGKRVVLKPNMVEYHRDRVINTDPRLIAAVIELCRGEGAAEIIVGEGPGHWRNTEYLVTASGLGEVLKRYNVPFIDLNHDDLAKLPNLGRLTGLEFLYFAKTIADADVLISLPKLKTHHWAGVTLSLKNLFGTLPGICYGWPKNELHWRGIENSIVDIALTRTPDLAIVDGIVGMEGDGPLNGTPVQMGVLLMGADPLAVDATCCRLMQIDPAKVGHLLLGYQRRLGILPAERIQQIGEPIKRHSRPFATLDRFAFLHGAERLRS